jgi:hypothetical protein
VRLGRFDVRNCFDDYHVLSSIWFGECLARLKTGDISCMHVNFVAAPLLLAMSLGLGGCFHHRQAVAAEPLPPPVSKPLK